LLVMLLCLGWGFSMTAMAQSPVQDPAKMWIRSQYPLQLKDTPEIKAEMEKARQLAGDDWYFLQTQRLQCSDVDESNTVVQTPGSNNNDQMNPYRWREAPAVPTKVFDNVYYVGGMEVGGWIIDTGAGYIMLDTSYAYGLDTILLPNMAALGLDPAKVKYILITHGSVGPRTADHSGAVKYFYDHYGTKVVMSGPEWARSEPGWIDPKDVIIGTDGQTLTLGDTTITMVSTPRRVGGDGFSYLIPVKIKGKRHMWATFGNTGLPSALSDKAVYRTSMAHFLEAVDNLGADIAISSHPFVDASLDRMKMIRECNDPRNRHDLCGPHNPFLIGKDAARRYFEIMDQCAVVRYEREAAGLPSNGVGIPDFPPW